MAVLPLYFHHLYRFNVTLINALQQLLLRMYVGITVENSLLNPRSITVIPM